MKRSRIFSLSLAVICLVLLTGCVNLIQEITVEEDGSGTLRFALGVETTAYPQFQELMPEEMAFENLLANLILDENITDVTQDTYEEGGYTWQTIELDVANFAVLLTEERSFGPIILEIDQDGDTFLLLQTLDLEGSNMSIPGINLLDLSGAGYEVRLNTPHILSTNGLQEQAGTSVWEISLGDLLQGEETIFLQAEYVLEPYDGVFIPWETFFPYIVIGFIVAGLLAILVVIIVNTAGKREKEQTLKF